MSVTTTTTTTTQTNKYVFAKTLRDGARNKDVLNLQKILNQDPDTQVAQTGAGSPGHETNYFGLATKAAVKKFQKKYGMRADGVVGPKTIKELMEVAK